MDTPLAAVPAASPTRPRSLRLAALLFLFSAAGAQADVTYHFDFTDLKAQIPGVTLMLPDFSLELTYKHFVTQTGMRPVTGNPLPTPFGYDVHYAGTNRLGWWGFDDVDHLAVITDDSYSFGGGGDEFTLDSFEFLVAAPVGPTNYYRKPGTFAGSVLANGYISPDNLGGFDGQAVLTITRAPIPEPGALALFLTGLGGLAVPAALHRRRG